MSTGELGKGVAIRLLTAVVFGVIGYFAIYYALQMVAIFGEGMGVDARSRAIYANSHMIVHVFAAACALAIGIFYYSRGWVLFSLALLAIIACGTYGVINMYGFASTNRVSVAAAKDAAKTAAERQYQSARTDLVKQIEWLQRTATQEEGRERRRLLAEVDAKRKELSALKAPVATAETVISDPGAATFGELTGTDQRRWLLTFPMILAVLMFFAESFSFVVVGHMLSGIVALFIVFASGRTKEDGKAHGGTSGTSGGGSHLTLVPDVPKPEPAAIKASAGRSYPAPIAINAEPVGRSSPGPIVIPEEPRIFQTKVAWTPHGTSSIDDADQVSNGGKRVKAAEPKRKRKAKVPFDVMRSAVRASLVHGERTRTIRDIGEETGWSHTHVLRQIEREEGIQRRKEQRHQPIRRDPRGLGASLH